MKRPLHLWNEEDPPPLLEPPTWWPKGERWEFDNWPHDDVSTDFPYWTLEVVHSPLTS